MVRRVGGVARSLANYVTESQKNLVVVIYPYDRTRPTNNVLYKRGVHTSEAFTPPTLRTSKAAHLNHIRIK